MPQVQHCETSLLQHFLHEYNDLKVDPPGTLVARMVSSLAGAVLLLSLASHHHPVEAAAESVRQRVPRAARPL